MYKMPMYGSAPTYICILKDDAPIQGEIQTHAAGGKNA